MCRKYLIPAGILIGFGAGMLLGLLLEAQLVVLIVGGGAICGGVCLLRRNCHA